MTTQEQTLPSKADVDARISELTTEMSKALSAGDFDALTKLGREAKRQEAILSDIALGEAKDAIASWQVELQETLDDVQHALAAIGFDLTVHYSQIENGWHVNPVVTAQADVQDRLLEAFHIGRPDIVSTAKYEFDQEHGVYAVVVGTGKTRVRSTSNGMGTRNTNPYMKDGKAYTLGEAFEACATSEQKAKDQSYTSDQRSARNQFRVSTVTSAGFSK